jgi:glutamyl-tRNA synthetase
VPALVDFLFLDLPAIDEASWQKAMRPGGEGGDDARRVLAGVATAFESVEWSAEALKSAVQAAGEAAGQKLSKAQAPVRVAVTGRTVGPPLFESLEVLGRDRVQARVQAALARL